MASVEVRDPNQNKNKNIMTCMAELSRKRFLSFSGSNQPTNHTRAVNVCMDGVK